MTFTQERAIKRESSINFLVSLQLKHLNDMFLQTRSFSLQDFSLDGLVMWIIMVLFGLLCVLCNYVATVSCLVTNILQNIIFCVQQKKENIYILGELYF